MAEFKIALQKTFAYEGGYSNDPDDLGSETTNKRISLTNGHVDHELTSIRTNSTCCG